MRTISNQDLFDKIVAHLRSMTERSVDSNSGNCRYRGDNGNRCAIGGIIKDEFYHPDIEIAGKNSVTCAGVMEAVQKSLDIDELNDGNFSVMRGLQDIHDNKFSNKEAEIKNFAAYIGLEYKP